MGCRIAGQLVYPARPHLGRVVRRGATSEEQLLRQIAWLGEAWPWLLNHKVSAGPNGMGGRQTALDVGCGPGLVMELISPFYDVKGMDTDPEMVTIARKGEMWSRRGMAMAFPFRERVLRLVYCSFTLLWVDDPQKAVQEMARMARRLVVLSG